MEDTQNNSLPVDLVISILLKLPEKSLVRFRCVSKSWLTLITSEQFIRLYLQTNKPSQCQSQNSSGSNSIILVGRNTILTYDFSGAQIVYKLPSPPVLLTRYRFVGLDNGLICFLHPNQPDELTVTIALYNPTTQAYRLLPALERRRGRVIKSNFGFGYDYKSNDFKIVSLLDLHRPHIYRLRTNSWERLIRPSKFKFTEYELNQGTIKTCVVSNNAIHWQVSESIIGFNLASEEFYRVPLPEIRSWNEVNLDKVKWDMTDLRGCLHLLITADYFIGQFSRSIEIWVMKKYGVKESWTKLLHYTSKEFGNLLIWTSRIYLEPRVYAYSKDNQEILFSIGNRERYFFSCHLQTREVKKVEALSNLVEENGNEGFSVMPWTCTFATCD